MLNVASMVPGIVWPAIPNGRASQMLALQFQLELSQWLSPEVIQQRQSQQIALLYRHAYESVPYYRKRFDASGLPPDKLLGSEQWGQVPLLTRRDIQQAGQDLHCMSGPKEHGPTTASLTSGSSGQPVQTLGTTVTRLFYNAFLLRQHIWHHRDFNLKLASIRSLGAGQEGKEAAFESWGPGTMGVVPTGPAVSLDVHTSLAQQADFLLRHDPDYLNAYPSVVLALTEYFERSGERLGGLREVRTFGEVLEPRVRAECRRVWGVPVVDMYSSQELGHIALQCPQVEQYHVQSESVLVEVLDDDGRSCEPGEVGRLVITSLHNFAMPLIRYDIGDFAEVGERCPCGRGLPVLTRIVGRQRQMFVLPDGRKVWPSLEISEAEHAKEMPPIQQFQLIQRTRDRLELMVVSPRLFTDDEQQLIRSWVDRAVGCRLELKITYVSDIARGATGKYEDFRCEVET